MGQCQWMAQHFKIGWMYVPCIGYTVILKLTLILLRGLILLCRLFFGFFGGGRRFRFLLCRCLASFAHCSSLRPLEKLLLLARM